MSLLASYLAANGVKVSGTDEKQSDRLTFLSERGIDVWTGFLPERTGKPDAVVFSSAIPESDAERSYLAALSVPMCERYELLGQTADRFATVVSVAGTHGKSTTSAMISHVLYLAKKRLFAHVGAEIKEEENFLYTGDDYFVCEACEYRKSMLALRSDICLILGAERDHPDTYESLDDVYDAFDLFCDLKKKGGIIAANGDCPYFSSRLSKRKDEVFTFGYSPSCRFRIGDVYSKNGCYGCRIDCFGLPYIDFNLKIIGEYNLMNAAACVAVCSLIGVDRETIKIGLETFSGVKRRFEKTGMFFGADVVTDYAHHPTEIKNALKAARSILKENGSLHVVFQPHTYSRTKAFFDDFARVLCGDFHVVIVKEYAARERPEDGVDARALFRALESCDKDYCDTVVDAAAILIKKTAPGDLILILGAGDVDTLWKILQN